MATLIQYKQPEPETAKMSGIGANGRSRTLADALARRPAPAARGRSELAVMEGIAELLGQLSDDAARLRVLQWIDSVYRRDESRLETSERLTSPAMSVQTEAPTQTLTPMQALAPTAMPAPAPVVVPTPVTLPPAADYVPVEALQESQTQELSDSDLSVEGLEEWFEPPIASQPAVSRSAGSETVVSQPAVQESAGSTTVVSPSALPAAATAETAVSQPTATPPATDNSPTAPASTSQPVVTLIHDFVADFQRLARDWQES